MSDSTRNTTPGGRSSSKEEGVQETSAMSGTTKKDQNAAGGSGPDVQGRSAQPDATNAPGPGTRTEEKAEHAAADTSSATGTSRSDDRRNRRDAEHPLSAMSGEQAIRSIDSPPGEPYNDPRVRGVEPPSRGPEKGATPAGEARK